MKTLETGKEIVIGMETRFADLWDGNGNGIELLQSGAISPDNENVVSFEVIECRNADDIDDILEAIVKVTDIY